MKHFLPITVLFFPFTVSWGQDQGKLLLDAYRSKSSEKLERFFNKWVMESPPVSPDEMNRLNDTVREVYLVFQEFYNPLKIERIGGSEWGNNIYSNVKYFVMQDNIRVGFVDTLDKEALLMQRFIKISEKLHVSVDSVRKGYTTDRTMRKYFSFDWPEAPKYGTLFGFRPRPIFQSPKTVMLSAKYDSILNGFLGNSHYPLGTGNVMSPAISTGESSNRQKFLEHCIKIWYGHWGGYWQLYSYPYVSSITFDKTLNYALVNFRLVYEGGYAYLKKLNNTWTLIEAGRTWIE